MSSSIIRAQALAALVQIAKAGKGNEEGGELSLFGESKDTSREEGMKGRYTSIWTM
jgi:hypothetical protein